MRDAGYLVRYASRWDECDPDDFEQNKPARAMADPQCISVEVPLQQTTLSYDDSTAPAPANNLLCRSRPGPTRLPPGPRRRKPVFAAAAATSGFPQVLAAAAGSFD